MSKILINDGAILTAKGWIEKGYVWIQSGRVAGVGSGDPSWETISQADEILRANHCAVMPGLVNAHTHLSQTFMRGLAGGRPLINWLRDVIWPLQSVISPEEIHLAALLGLVENLRCGTTAVTDHHKIVTTPRHTDKVLKAAQEVGVRVALARSWSDKGVNPEAPEAILGDLERLFGLVQGEDRLSVANGPIALWRCSGETLSATRNLAMVHGSFTHFHVAESKDEVDLSLQEYGLRPIEWLEATGMLGPDTQLVHAVWLEDHEINLIARSGATVVHCPVSNAVLGSGVAPVPRMVQKGIDIRLGTDGPASNDTQDIWETLKAAVNFARALSLDPTILPPVQALRLATGGKVIQEGMEADLILVNLNHPRVAPVQDIDSALVLGTHGTDVETVIVGGEILMRDHEVLVIDEDVLLEECRVAIRGLRARAGMR